MAMLFVLLQIKTIKHYRWMTQVNDASLLAFFFSIYIVALHSLTGPKVDSV